MTENLAYGYSFESTQRELSNEYQHDRVWMVFQNLCVLMLRTKAASVLKVLMVTKPTCAIEMKWYDMVLSETILIPVP